LSDAKKDHVEYQRRYFDTNVDFFRQDIPEDVLIRSREIAAAIIKEPSIRILDVGTGIGAFLKHYIELGVPYSNIVGCDLSNEMLAEAKKRYPEICFWQGDILDFPEDRAPFDLIVFNACFGNIYDQLAVLKKSTSLLDHHGRIAISHPMGNTFVERLKDSDPSLVLTLLPDREKLSQWSDLLGLILLSFRDEEQLYLSLLEKP